MGNSTSTITANLADIGLTSGGTVKVTDLWTGEDIGTMKGNVSASVETHDSAAFRVQLLGSSTPSAVL
jgi:alpha-galactosidase